MDDPKRKEYPIYLWAKLFTIKRTIKYYSIKKEEFSNIKDLGISKFFIFMKIIWY
jgi:hypothetical protein